MNSSLTLQCKTSTAPHPEGIHPAICIDVIALGLVEVVFQGQHKVVPKVKLVFETEQKTEEGTNYTVSKNFTASLHPKAKLCEYLSKWRGRPIAIGETIELQKLIGANCTLVISHAQNMVGRTYASIDAISKPTKKLLPSGTYNPEEMRRKIAEARARESGPAAPVGTPRALAPMAPAQPPVPVVPVAQPAIHPRQPAPAPVSLGVSAEPEYDPDVGF